MAQRRSGYRPARHDRYFTPAWAVGALFDAYDFGPSALPASVLLDRAGGPGSPSCSSSAERDSWTGHQVDAWEEPCAGSGHICAALDEMGLGPIFASDIAPLPDADVWRGPILMADARMLAPPYLALEGKRVVTVTNVPYGHQGKLACELLRFLIPRAAPNGAVAALMGVGFDTRPTRYDLFRENPAFTARIVLTTRIRWANLKQKKKGPSGAHWWAVWDWANKGWPGDAWRSKEDGLRRLDQGVPVRLLPAPVGERPVLERAYG